MYKDVVFFVVFVYLALGCCAICFKLCTLLLYHFLRGVSLHFFWCYLRVLKLFASPTYKSGSFLCDLCEKTGSGFCFCCSNCEFDLHIHCAYNTLNPRSPTSLPDEVELKSHPNHRLKLFPKPPYINGRRLCDVCGTKCDPNGELYPCDVCDYDVHVTCTTLQESVCREDHTHTLSLLYVNPHLESTCDVCRGAITQKHCMYRCSSGCDYGMHVKCVGLIELSRGHG
ncbi:putative chromatin regulator PHD family [Helianthus annuus]|uniref:Chromatin regulator PHD family n=1 Tax=Helianthus annuus TaxID=4232 RepID=A0A9K3E033_HELAN|nr:putative chromatin regulator PHD family [Helianthus annuus]KAJ0451250.1 putative chromatin regulator PHD family [Helianthus annuus]KAJ0455710.1 putative chromatin regulator PHD family [Helianthus annuus]KAJ0473118.1 putative chromatin regulator PHD family [Helianthus annuus]KAJ0629190.1 putative chromatin regulator PHD family [Helianthus annuus]